MNDLAQALENARRSEAQLRALFEHAPIGISVAKGVQLLYANRAYVTMFGYNEFSELQGQSLLDQVAPQSRQLIQERIELRQREVSVPNDYEAIGQRKDGSQFPYQVKLSRLETADGWATVAFVTDISERKRSDLVTAAFARLGQSLSSATSQQEAARIILLVADELLGWDCCFLEIGQAEGRMIVCFDVIDGKRCELREKDMANEPVPLWRQRLKEPRLILRTEEEQRNADAPLFGNKTRRSASLIYSAIRHRDELIGYLSIQSYAFNAYTQDDLEILQRLSDHCGGAFARLRAQEALRQSDAQFRLVWENSRDGMRLIDRDSRIVAVNEAFCRLVEAPRESLLDRPCGDFHHKCPVPSDLAEWSEAFEKHTLPPASDYEVLRANGKPLHVEVSHSFLESEAKPTLLLSIFRDITERRQIEKRNAAFSRLSHKFASATTAAEAARIIRDIAEELFGWDSFTVFLRGPEPDRVLPLLYIDTINGRRVEMVPASVSVSIGERNRRVILQSKAELELRVPPVCFLPSTQPFGDLTRPSASIMAAPIRHGQATIGLISVQSYTPNAYARPDLDLLQSIADQCGGAMDRIRAVDALKTSEARLHSVWDHAVDGMRLTDEEGIVIATNPAFCKLTLMDASQIEGKPFTVTMPVTEDQGQAMRLYKERFQKRIIDKPSIRRLAFRSGQTADVECTQCFVELPEKKPLLLGIFRDVTEQKDLQDRLRQAQKMESVGQLAGGVAHDFNNVLTVIQGHTELLLCSKDLSPDQIESLQEIAAAANRSAHLTRQLLTFSRQQILAPKNLNFNEVINEAARLLRSLLREDIILRLDLAPDPPIVYADKGMMEQILMNLAVNARDAMPKGGKLTIATQSVNVSEAEARKHPDAYAGHFLKLTVNDTGCGIPPQCLPRIFEPFFTTKDPGRGTGLGLATVYGIVRQHHGWLAVNSVVGQGASFEIHLPESKACSISGSGPFARVRGGTETILMVEKEASLRQFVKLVLERHGYKVLGAESAPDALELAREYNKPIHLLLTDLPSSDIPSSGELGKWLKTAHPAIKSIFTSADNAEIADPNSALGTGCVILQKPYQPHLLAQAVRACLDTGNPQARGPMPLGFERLHPGGTDENIPPFLT